MSKTTEAPSSGMDAPPPLGAARALLPRPVLALALLVLYVGLEWLSFLHEHNDLPVTPWNPGLGVMVAMIILHGRAMGLVLLVGVVLSQVIVAGSELPLAATFAMAAIIALTYTAVARIVARKLDLASELLRTRDMVLLALAGLVGAVIVAILLFLLLFSIRHFQPADIARTSLPLIVGDVIGIAVVTPLVLRIAALHRPLKLSPPLAAEVLALVVATALILLVGVRPPGHGSQNLFYLLFAPVMIASVRHGIDGACGSLALAQLGLVAVLHWHGFDLTRFTEHQLLMLALTLTGLVVGGLVSEREAADRAAESARARLRELEAQAARAARLNLVSGMAAALAHEINQPMTAARALARSVQELTRTPGSEPERTARNIAGMIEQIDHAGAVVSRMREFLRRGEPHVSTLEISQILAEAIALVQPLVRSRRLELRVDTPQDLPLVHGDRVQIGQVIVNLVKNSVDAIAVGARGEIVVSAREAEGGRSVEISVRDDGPGIAAHLVPVLFDPLSTTRADGLGLGLSICRSIVQAHGGRIWLACADAGATELRFSLPTTPICPQPSRP